jgi:hypothetical protein
VNIVHSQRAQHGGSRFPALAAHGIHAWDGNRDQRFTAGLETLLRGLQADMPPPGASGES